MPGALLVSNVRLNADELAQRHEFVHADIVRLHGKLELVRRYRRRRQTSTKNNEFAAGMRKVDPSITLIGSAKMLEPMFLKGENRAKYADDIQPLYGSDIDWTGGLLAHSWGTFDGVAEHWYESPGRHFDIERAKSLPPDAPEDDAYVKYDPTLLEFARYAGNVIRRKAEEWQGYQQRFPAMLDKKIFLSIDEYA